jgi:hypothetical protein
VVAVTDALHPPGQTLAHAAQAGFLLELPDHRLGEGLSGFDPAAWYRPLALGRTTPPPHQKDLIVVDGDCADAQLRPTGHRRARLSHGLAFPSVRTVGA